MSRLSNGAAGLRRHPSCRVVSWRHRAAIRPAIILAAVASIGTITAAGPLQVVNLREQTVFPGPARAVYVLFHNRGPETFDARITMRIYQTTSATAALLSAEPWKRLRVLPGQTVLESARVNFPAVKAPTRFVIQWLDDTNRVSGTTGIWVYPTNLLAGLRALLGRGELGLFDPQDQIKPALLNAGVHFSDLAESRLVAFGGRLAIIAAFHSRAPMPSGLARRIEVLARKGVPVIWVVPRPARCDGICPLFCPVPVGRSVIWVTRGEALRDLEGRPLSQLRLLSLCRTALRPETSRLAELTAGSRN